MKQIRTLLMLLLFTVGAQSAWADWTNRHADVVIPDPINGVTYELCHVYSRRATIEALYGMVSEAEITNEDYYASVVAISATGNVVIPDTITNGGVKYPMRYIGKHTEQTITRSEETYLFLGNTRTGTFDHYNYSQTPVSLSPSGITRLTFNGHVTFSGYFNPGSCSYVEFKRSAYFFADVVFNASEIKFGGVTYISQGATLFVYNAPELRFNKLTHNGIINCGNRTYLTDIYYLDNIPAYSGSASNYFEDVNLGQITAHVANKTIAECDAMHTSWAVYSSFAAVVPCSTSGTSTFSSNQTFVRIGGAGTASVTTKHDGETTSYDIPADGLVTAKLYDFDSGDFIRIVVQTNGEETVEIYRDGIDVTSIFTKNGTTYTFEADDWEANTLWFEYLTNVLDEAVWTIKYTDQRRIITFKDDAVKAICLANWDTNGDNELSMAEAAAVTDIAKKFGTRNITSFDELQYFTGLTELKDQAFMGAENLKSVIVPEGVTRLGNNAFKYNYALESIVLPSTLTTLGNSVFSECNTLESIILPESLTNIGEYGFAKCYKLKSITIPENVTTIGSMAFEDCTSLTTLFISKAVTSMGRIIPGCTNLSAIVVDKDNPVYDSRNNCDAILEKETNKLIMGCKATVIPEDVTSLEASCFREQGITSIVIPASVQEIYTYAFMGCSDLLSIECKGLTPPELKNASWFYLMNENCVLTVPYGKIQAYADAGWKKISDGGNFLDVVEKEVGTSPDLKITLVNGSGGKMALGLTYNGQPAAQRWIEGGDAFSISTLQKEKLGDEFTLTAIMEPGRKNAGVRINGYACPIASSSGDTLFYNLGNLKEHGDSVVITSLYKDLTDLSKSRIHIKSKGTPGNLTRWALRDVTKKKDVFNVAVSDVPTLDRIDTLDVNTQYNFAFYGSTDNVKRVLINGEEVTLSTGSIKRTPNRILRSFDDEIFIELEGTVHAAYSMNDGGNTCMRAYYEGELISYARSEATEVNLDGIDANKPITLWLTPNEGFTVQLLLNGRNIPLADATTPEESIPGNYMVKNDGGYEFVLPAEINTGGSEARFNIIYKKISFFDVNGDGEINVSDVTALVNKILHP